MPARPRSETNASIFPDPTSSTSLPAGATILVSLTYIEDLESIILATYSEISTLCTATKPLTPGSERETAVLHLQELVQTLETHIEEHKEAVRGIDMNGVAGLLVVAGVSREEALTEVKGDFEALERRVEQVGASGREMVKDFVSRGGVEV
jgi:hypothetical protein